MRQFIYSKDLAFLIVSMVVEDLPVLPDGRVICATSPNAQVSIAEVASLIAKQFGLTYIATEATTLPSSSHNGQHSKAADLSQFKRVFGNEAQYELTDLTTGIEETCTWYKVVYSNSNSNSN